MDATTGLWALFTSSFLAATLLPGGSEIVLYGLLKLNPDQLWPAIVVATFGNTLGGMTSYAIGRVIPRTKRSGEREGGTAPARSAKGIALVKRYGSPVLLLSWVPLIGDPLCVAAGWLRVNAALACALIAAGKLARYVAIAAAAV